MAKLIPNPPATIALLGFLRVDRPWYAEAICQETKTGGPERFLKRHANGSSLRQAGKQRLCIAFTWLEHDAEAPWGFICARSGIGALQRSVADDERGVSNLAAPFRRRFFSHRRI